jgi:hypothetical protein
MRGFARWCIFGAGAILCGGLVHCLTLMTNTMMLASVVAASDACDAGEAGACVAAPMLSSTANPEEHYQPW